MDLHNYYTVSKEGVSAKAVTNAVVKKGISRKMDSSESVPTVMGLTDIYAAKSPIWLLV